MKNSIFKDYLFWKVTATFLVILVAVGLAYIFIITDALDKNFQERNQRLNAKMAAHIIEEVKPFLNGEITKDATSKIMHHMMAINPSIEVYLLDPEGNILNYVAPYKKVKLESVSLSPISDFIASNGEECILGDDPRNPGRSKVFSAAPVYEDQKLIGYVYVILAGEEFDSVSATSKSTLLWDLGLKSVGVTILIAFVVGLAAIWFITSNLRHIRQAFRNFQNGDMNARIPNKFGKGELADLAETFNEMADTIQGNIEHLKSMENLRRELVGNVSHDLRTPLAVIHGYIETLIMKKDEYSPEERDKYLEVILESTEKLKKLVEELFELSKLEARQITPKKEPFYINELIQDIIHKYELIIAQKGITIEPIFKKNISLVHADLGLIERVLQNLIDNAIKFTPEGGKITLETNDLQNYVEIRVTDTGKGIPEEQIPFVFDRYHIGDKRLSLDNNSTGLGLAIVKKILEIHDATIRLTSNMNQGTTFAFELPYYTK